MTTNVTDTSASKHRARPLLKWAGGKRQLLPVLRGVYPSHFGRYFEPFAGSAAVFFDLHTRGRATEGAHLIDCNVDLIGCYESVRDRPGEVIEELTRLADGHARAGTAHYYAVREAFNQRRRDRGGPDARGPRIAAMFLYLNRTGYNGLFRLNAAGSFNVPAGRYVRPRICDPVLLRAVSTVLGAPGVQLHVGAFDMAVADARRDDFIYFDPPYVPVSTTATFNTYTAAGFDTADQMRLRDAIVALHERGCHVVASNSSAQVVLDLYRDAVASSRGALQLWTVPARRAINSRGESRGAIREVLLTNVVPRWSAAAEIARLA